MRPLRWTVGFGFLLGSMLLVAPRASLAQDVAVVAPNSVKVLLENDQVRVLEIRIKPGEKIAMHSHPAHVLYALEASKNKSTTADGKSEDREFKAGEARWNDAQTHASENVGTTEGHVLLVEMKKK